jgi:hypothetical protein
MAFYDRGTSTTVFFARELRMTTRKPTEMQRRRLLQTAAGLAIGQVALHASGANPAADPPPGRAGDFDFLAGAWKISHRRLKTTGSDDWDVFDGEATCWTILGGVASIEELRIPQRGFSGMGLRLLDIDQRVWSDFWVNGKSGVLTPPGMTGGFDNGIGTFVADDVDDNRPIKVRGIWDRITPSSCRWHQAISRDGGMAWEGNWFMDWVRA